MTFQYWALLQEALLMGGIVTGILAAIYSAMFNKWYDMIVYFYLIYASIKALGAI